MTACFGHTERGSSPTETRTAPRGGAVKSEAEAEQGRLQTGWLQRIAISAAADSSTGTRSVMRSFVSRASGP